MKTCRILLLILLCVPSWTSGKMYSPDSIIISTGGLWYCFTEAELHRSSVNGPNSSKTYKQCSLPSHTIWCGVRGEEMYALTSPHKTLIVEDGAPRETVIQNVFYSDDFGKWKPLGKLEVSLSQAIALVPLKNNRFFLVSSLGFFRKNEEASPFCIGALDKTNGVISLERLVDLDFDGPMLRIPKGAAVPVRRTAMWEKYIKYRLVMTMQTDDTFPLRQVDNKFIIWSNHFGYFWTFDENGNLLKRIALFPELSDGNISNRWNYERAILGVQPALDGSVIVASRTHDAVLKSRQIYPMIGTDNQRLRLNNRFAVEDFPEVIWWGLDLNSWNFSEVQAPQGAPLNLLDARTERAYKFVVKPDGRVTFPLFH